MNSRQRFMAVLHGEMPDRVPYADWIDPMMRQKLATALGQTNPDEARLAKLLGMDAIGFQGIYDLAPVCDVTKTDDQGKVHYLGQGLIHSIRDLERMVFPDPRRESLYDEAKRFVDRYGKEDLALYCGIRPGIQPTYLSLGWMRFAESIVFRDGLAETVYDRFIDWNCVLVEKLQTIGFDFFFLYDDIAHKTGPIMSPEDYRQRFLPPLRRLADTIAIPWAYHSDGNLTLVLDDLLTLGMNAINPIEPTAMDINRVKQDYGDRVALWGNIDMVHTLYDASLGEVDTEVAKRISEIGRGGGYICATANSIADYLSVENVLEMGRAIKKYGRYPLD